MNSTAITQGARALRPLEHSGDSANIAFYRERGAKPREPYVWAEVLCSAIQWGPKGGPHKAKRHADYRITVYRNGQGEIAKFTYTPKRRTDHPGGAGALASVTVARLIRAELQAP